jgi:Ni,Fe-hydrogenase maturation factor
MNKGGNQMTHTIKPTHSIEIKELLRIADRTIKTEKNLYLFQEGQVAEELYLVLSGKVQISKIT